MKMGRPPKQQGKIPHFEQKGKSFYHVPATGNRKWTPLGNDRAAALIKWASLEGRTQSGTFGDLFRWFIAGARIEESTKSNYVAQGAAILRVFGDAPPDSITPHALASYRDKCTPGTANVRIGLIKTIFSAACEKGLCKTNPAREVKRLPRKKRTRYITDDEFVAIRNNAEDFLRVAMNIAYELGCRPVDVRMLKIYDIGPDGVLLTAKKTKKTTQFTMSAELRSALDEAASLERGVKSLYVLSDWRGQPYTSHQFNSAWIRACEAAGVEGAQFRDIRAKNASDDPVGAQNRLQHSSAEQTKTYIRKTPVVMPLARKL